MGLYSAYVKQFWYSSAIKSCKKAIELNPEHYEALNRLAWLYLQKNNNLNEGIELSKKSILLKPNFAEYYDTLAKLYFATNEVDKAIESAQKTFSLEPNNPYFKQQLTRLTEKR